MIYRNETNLEVPRLSLTDFVLRRAADLADKPAIVEAATGRVFTYAQLADAIRATAAGLAARGFGKGHVFGVYSHNVPEYAIAFHAVASLGGAVTPINPLSTANEAATQLRDSGARGLVAHAELVDKAREAAAAVGIDELFVFGEAEGVPSFSSLAEAGGEPPSVEVDFDDLVALPYSSGTTGLPKGVMLTHRNLVSNICQFESCGIFVGEEEVFAAILPFFHIYGLTVVLNGGLAMGATVVIPPRFDLPVYLQVLQDYRVTFAHVVPPILLALAKHPIVDQYDLSALRVVFSGAAPLGAELSRECAERLGCEVRQGYGMTETSPGTHTAADDPSELKLGSVGRVLPLTLCKVVDVDSGEELGRKREGEICVRGPQVMKGYLNNPAATAAMIDKEGWLHTGDIGYADEDGHFFIVDRVKELIKYKGFPVAPAELEAVLLSHPAVADAAVIPTPDPESGEMPKAFVVLRGEATGDEIMEFVAGRVASYKKLREVEFVDQIPKSASGKILRRVLVAQERMKK